MLQIKHRVNIGSTFSFTTTTRWMVLDPAALCCNYVPQLHNSTDCSYTVSFMGFNCRVKDEACALVNWSIHNCMSVLRSFNYQTKRKSWIPEWRQRAFLLYGWILWQPALDRLISARTWRVEVWWVIFTPPGPAAVDSISYWQSLHLSFCPWLPLCLVWSCFACL